MSNYNQYCQDKTSKSGSSFYYSFLFLSKKQRQAINAIYAFCREVDDIIDDCNNQEIAAKKIAWWQEEVNRIYQNKAEHPIGLAISEARLSYNIKQQYLLDMLDGMIMDLKYNSYDNFNDIKQYCYCVASTVGLLVTEVFGYSNKATLEYAKNLGIALQLTNIIRDVGEDARKNRLYLPIDEITKFNLTTEDILNIPAEYNANFINLMNYQAKRAREYYNLALEQLPKEDRYLQISGLIMAKIYFALLEEIEQDNFSVLHNKISLTPIRKLWLAWQTARQEKKTYKKHQKVFHELT